MTCKIISIQNETLELHPLKAIFWERKGILILSDIHFGKVQHFRKEGIAIPSVAREKDYQNLANLLTVYAPKQLFIIGDLFHSDRNQEWEELKRVKQKFSSTKWILVAGNHDTSTLKSIKELGIEVVFSLIEAPFYFSHEPEEKEGFYSISGHIHPGVILKGPAKQRMRMQCFYFSKSSAILPAFGNLTGKYIIQPQKEDKIFVSTGKEVIEI